MQLPAHFDSPLEGRFVIEQLVGQGASASVYRAFDLHQRRWVALKILTQEDAELREGHSAFHETQLLERLDHPGIVKVWEVGYLRSFARPFIAMEWIEGGSLRARHITSPLSVRQITAVGVLLTRALNAAHQSGIVHRDIKPENILLRSATGPDSLQNDLDFEPVLVDFGIAILGTQGHLAGTPAYMSPEQARGDALLDPRTDLYSLGATLFELIVGRPPHQGTNSIATLARLTTTPAPRMSLFRPELPRHLDEVVDSLLRTQRQQRPADAKQVEQLLLDCLEEALPPSFPEQEPSSRLGTGVSRLVTTIVAIDFGLTETRDQALERLQSQGAEAVPLGPLALVSHWGVHQATGSEARAALALGHALAQSGASVGIASGRAHLRSMGQAHSVHPVGEVVDRAASLARDSKPHQVLSDATTTELGRGSYEFRVREDGSAIVGGVLRHLGTERSGGAPFVGREAELAQILSAHDRMLHNQNPVVLTITGPPGIGKSRLQKEAIARISSLKTPPRVIVQRSDAYGRQHVLGAAADALRSLIELRKGATFEEAEQALLEKLGPSTWNNGSQAHHQLLARLLVNQPLPQGLHTAGIRDALWLAMTELMLQELSDEPLVIVVEDLQWADAESVLWFEHLLGRTTKNPFLLIACVRPQFWGEHEARFVQRDLVRIELKPLSKRAARAIAQAVLGGTTNADQVEDIAEQAAGSPLFAEELARLAVLGRAASKAPTIEAAIQVSLDSLDPECRDAVGRLSVLGLSTWDDALFALGLDQAEELMRELAKQEILIEQDASRFPQVKEYLFKHALIRDVAYAALDSRHRIELHSLAGRWLAAMGGDAATVADHLELGEDQEVASEYWERAAARALSANALQDAWSMAERALDFANAPKDAFRRASLLDEIWSRLDPRAADRETAVSAMESHAYDESSRLAARGARARYDDARGIGLDISERLAEVRDAATRLEQHAEVARCSATLASRAAFRGDFAVAEAEVERLLALSVQEMQGAKVDAYQTRAIIKQAEGAVFAALEARRSAVKAARQAGLKEREAMLTTNLGFALSTVGARLEAREALDRGLILAESIGSRGAERHAQMNLLGWASLYGNDRKLDAALAETRTEADAVANGHWAAPDRSNLGVLFYRGAELLRSPLDATQGRALVLLRQVATSYRELGHLDVLPVALGTWAEAERVCGAPDQAAEIAREAAELLESGAPSLLNEAPVFLTLYKARLELGDEEGARQALQLSLPPLRRRLQGLVNSPYARGFLTELQYNAELIATLDAASLLPSSFQHILVGEHETYV